MNMKVMSKMAIGGACLASGAIGAICTTMCINKDNDAPKTAQKEIVYVDNILNEDVIEISKPSKADDICYENNKKLDKRLSCWGRTPKDLESTYQQMGTYAGTLFLQSSADFASTAITEKVCTLRDKIRSEVGPIESLKTHPQYEELKELEDLQYECASAESEYKKETKEEIKRVLCSENTPSKLDCFTYITGALHREGLDDKEMEELNKDLANFDKSLGKETNQTYAEKLAYRQFKKDSIVGAHILETMGLWEDPEIRFNFKDYLKKTAHRPKP